MPVFKINVKWQKEKYNDIECNTDESPEMFKVLLFSLTGVPPERQTIMMPGGTLKDNWKSIKVKDGITIMMMGSSEKLPDKPTESEIPKFIEDMTEGQITKALKLPQGLQNIGNTCYMNATLQCFRSIPEISFAIKKIKDQNNVSDVLIHTFVKSIGDLFLRMQTAQNPINPMYVLKKLHEICPQFATTQNLPPEKGGGSMLMQQDANECYTEILRCFQKILNVDGFSSETEQLPDSFGKNGNWNFVDQFLTGKLAVNTLNSEDESEKIQTQEPFLQLSCFIDKEVKYLQTGIRNGLEGNLTKMSETLGRDALFKRTSRISRLPAYLSVQFVRFFYKERENINAKVLKDVKFPLSLDMYEFCTDELQKKMLEMRVHYKSMEDRLAQQERVRKSNVAEGQPSANKDSKNTYYPYWFDEDIGSNNSGIYELQAVLTHQGRSSSSGHYVGWVRHETSNDLWLKYDDDVVTQMTSEDILRLSGGGDWHCAYVLLYGPKRIEKCPSELGVNNGDIDEKVNQSMDIGQ